MVAQQPGQIALAVTDSQAARNFLPSVYPPYKANGIEELARIAGFDAEKLSRVPAK